MTDKKGKDIWDKISDAAASAGKAIGDEYQKLRLTHDIWLLDRDLLKAYAKVGQVFYERYKAEGEEIGDDLQPVFDEIEELRNSIKKFEVRRNNIQETIRASSTEKEQSSEAGPGKEPEMEFLDEDDLPLFCSECGSRLDIYSKDSPKFCIRCGHKITPE